MENELIRLERMRAMWELSAGVSHNLNNILTGVLVPAQILERTTTDNKKLENIKMISESGHAAADLVRRLHQAMQTEEDTPEAVQVNQVVRNVIQATQPRWQDEPESRGIAIEVETDLQDDYYIWGSKTGLFDCLINLVFNAVDAMPQGGKLHIATSSNENEIGLKITDTGKGMDEETLKRVFEPFFTTKMNIGTGLGLFMVYGTITRWGGHIEVDSEPDHGTSFTLTLPIWKADKQQASHKLPDAEARSGRILVVEDDPTVSAVVQEMLNRHHEVRLFGRGQLAYSHFEPGQFDVAIIDLGLPGQSGDQLAGALKELDPALVTVMMTGWKIQPDDPRRSNFDFYLEKPFHSSEEIEQILTHAIILYEKRCALPSSSVSQ